MDADLKELARTDMREAMRKEFEKNQNFIDSIWVKRNTPRHVKEAVFQAMARNNALYSFLELEESQQTPERLRGNIPISKEYENLMYRIGATRYPLQIKREAEWDLYRDYTHIDYKRRRHFLDEALPEKPKAIVRFEKISSIMSFIFGFVFRFWWVSLIAFMIYISWSANSSPDSSGSGSKGQSNTFGSGGIRGGNSENKPVSDLPQVKDNSNQAGFGNAGVSGHDAHSSVEANTKSVSVSGDKRTISNFEDRTTAKPIQKPAQVTETQSTHTKVYFTIGSNKDEVRTIMGDPDNIQQLFSEERWSYGLDSITFNEAERVVAYSNLSEGLKVWLSDRTNDAPAFNLNSGVNKVLDAMGTPTSIMKLFTGTQWWYEYSTITFNTDSQVIAYNDVSNNLNVWIADKDPKAPPFKVGSTRDEVLRAMGTPTSVVNLFDGQGLGYDLSSITISNGKVSDYSDISKNLKIKK